jgi:hypothetical protein
MSHPDLMATLPSPLLLSGELGFTHIFARTPEGSRGERFFSPWAFFRRQTHDEFKKRIRRGYPL